MMLKLSLAIFVLIACFGCSGDDSGNIAVANKAAQAAPKKPSDLPQNMPPEAKAAATAAMGQAQAQQQMNSDPARVHAMQMMQQQKGH